MKQRKGSIDEVASQIYEKDVVARLLRPEERVKKERGANNS